MDLHLKEYLIILLSLKLFFQTAQSGGIFFVEDIVEITEAKFE